MGDSLLIKVSSSPVITLFIWPNGTGPPMGAHPRNAGGVGAMYADFHPFLWIPIPVNMSSTTDPYCQPTYNFVFNK